MALDGRDRYIDWTLGRSGSEIDFNGSSGSPEVGPEWSRGETPRSRCTMTGGARRRSRVASQGFGCASMIVYYNFASGYALGRQPIDKLTASTIIQPYAG